MKKTKNVFERYEKKYLLSTNQYQALLPIIEKNMQIDEYGKYRICNIYYDNESYDIIQHSLQKPDYKEKFRVRSYGRADSGSTVFMELKKKVCGIVYKRRCAVNKELSDEYIAHGIPKDAGQVMKEIDWAIEQNNLKPAAYIGYERTAYAGIENKELRVTFDFDIRYRDYDLDLAKGSYGEKVLDDGFVLMEIKIPGAMPLELSHVLSELEIFPTSFSKYGEAYKKFVIGGKTKGAMNCA